ncbi:MAG: REJ domain-containing protein, partial [Kangiellaceae bacterium]|nr:REJ domain-containing protein [Kangiellaceae bacterium]
LTQGGVSKNLENNTALSVVVPSTLLEPGLEYIISLTAKRGADTLRTDHRFITKSPPMIGTSTVKLPASSRAVETDFGLILSGYSSTAEPLTH